LESGVPQEVKIKSIGIFDPLDQTRDFISHIIPFQIEQPPESIDFMNFENKFLVENISKKQFVFEAVLMVKDGFIKANALPGQVTLKQKIYDGIFLRDNAFGRGQVCHGYLSIVADRDVHLTSKDSFSISREHEEVGRGNIIRRLTKRITDEHS